METDLTTLSIIIGAIVTFVAPIIYKSDMGSALRALIAIVLSVIGAVIAAAIDGYVDGSMSAEDISTAFVVVFGAALVVYKGITGPIGISKAIEKNTPGGT